MSSPLVISWSALRSHEECKQKTKLIRAKKSSPVQDIRNYFHGTVADMVMRTWLLSDSPAAGEMVQMVDDIARECELEALRTGDGIVRWRGAKDKATMLNFIRELVQKLEPFLFEHVLPYDYQPEMPFKVPMSIPAPWGGQTHIYLAGRMDIVVREQKDPDVWALYDLKATANDSYVTKTIGQGVFYDTAAIELFGSEPRTFGFVTPMCKKQLVTMKVTEQDRLDLLTRVIRMAHDIWEKNWEVTDDKNVCYNCPVKHACVKFKPAPGSKTVPLGGT